MTSAFRDTSASLGVLWMLIFLPMPSTHTTMSKFMTCSCLTTGVSRVEGGLVLTHKKVDFGRLRGTDPRPSRADSPSGLNMQVDHILAVLVNSHAAVLFRWLGWGLPKVGRSVFPIRSLISNWVAHKHESLCSANKRERGSMIN